MGWRDADAAPVQLLLGGLRAAADPYGPARTPANAHRGGGPLRSAALRGSDARGHALLQSVTGIATVGRRAALHGAHRAAHVLPGGGGMTAERIRALGI